MLPATSSVSTRISSKRLAVSIFRISLQHNDTYAFRQRPVITRNQEVYQDIVPDMSGSFVGGASRCEWCEELLSKWDESLRGVVIKQRKHDLSVTYDGVLIASERFVAAYTANGLSGMVFRRLPDDSCFFAVRAIRAIEFDSVRRKTRFIDRCQYCGNYESVVGAVPVFLRAGSEVGEREVVRTDLVFGSGDEKHPLLICGSSAASIIASASLKGVDLIPIEEDGGSGG